MRVLRVYHGGRDPSHRLRDRALAAAGHEITLVVPRAWPEAGGEEALSAEPFEVVELEVARAGDVNRHHHADDDAVRALLRQDRWDVLDLHEEPVSLVARQWLEAAPPALPVAMYTAQNIDKRFPPPFAAHERAALFRADALYPCSRQAASVARGKGFSGPVRVLPLGYDNALLTAGSQDHGDGELRLLLVGRLVPEKGVLDAVEVFSRVQEVRQARLVLIGDGPALDDARALAARLGVSERLEHRPWLTPDELADEYRRAHVVVVPSRATHRWVEQFGRVVVEAQATGAVVAGYASGSLPEVVDRAGELAAEADVAGLARRVSTLAAEPERWARHRQAGLVLAAERTWGAVAAAHAAVWEEAVERPAPVQADRASAHAEFGATAVVDGGDRRPFALPILRGAGAAARALGRLTDAVSTR